MFSNILYNSICTHKGIYILFFFAVLHTLTVREKQEYSREKKAHTKAIPQFQATFETEKSFMGQRVKICSRFYFDGAAAFYRTHGLASSIGLRLHKTYKLICMWVTP